MTERNGIQLSESAAKHIAYFESDAWREVVRGIFSVSPTLDQCLKFVNAELREAMDSLEPMAPGNGRALDGWHAGCAVLRAWATLTGTHFRKVLTALEADADEMRWVVEALDAAGVPTVMGQDAEGKDVLYTVHGRVQAGLDGGKTSAAVPEAQPNFSLSMETRGIVIKGEAFVVEGAPNIAAAWADLSEKLHALGINVTRTDDPPREKG